MFLSCFEKLQFFSKISFLQKSVHRQLGTKIPTVLTVFADVGVLRKKSQHTHFKSLSTRCRYSLEWGSFYLKVNGKYIQHSFNYFEQYILFNYIFLWVCHKLCVFRGI